MKPKRPIIGFAGIVLILIAFVVACKHIDAGLIIGGLGVVVLIYALFTGNLKFWG